MGTAPVPAVIPCPIIGEISHRRGTASVPNAPDFSRCSMAMPECQGAGTAPVPAVFYAPCPGYSRRPGSFPCPSPGYYSHHPGKYPIVEARCPCPKCRIPQYPIRRPCPCLEIFPIPRIFPGRQGAGTAPVRGDYGCPAPVTRICPLINLGNNVSLRRVRV